ncbi:MAG: hypothetical protein Q9223_003230 [Gallowayella weberi]
MEKPVSGLDEPPALTILRHDEHLVFPGYDVMVGKVWKGQDEEAGCNSCTAQNYEGEGDPAAEGQNSARLSWYQKHKRKLIVAAIIWYAALARIKVASAKSSTGTGAGASSSSSSCANSSSGPGLV